MKDDRLERALSDAINDLAGTSAPDYLDDILERTSRTRQRPWWTFPRRYFTMAPTLKFVTAASLAFVLGIGLAPLIMARRRWQRRSSRRGVAFGVTRGVRAHPTGRVRRTLEVRPRCQRARGSRRAGSRRDLSQRCMATRGFRSGRSAFWWRRDIDYFT